MVHALSKKINGYSLAHNVLMRCYSILGVLVMVVVGGLEDAQDAQDASAPPPLHGSVLHYCCIEPGS